ncbi:MAG: arginine--tRNA ligase [Gammaproteobacteria bacterium]|nr:arginine--tRNA ligase [Gammaproteobacteria bacterium]
MKEHLITLLENALAALCRDGIVQNQEVPTVSLEATRQQIHGDFSSNIAMLLAKLCRMAPLSIAKRLVAEIPPDPAIRKIEVVQPGFINFFVQEAILFDVIAQALRDPLTFGRSSRGRGTKIQLEFVSANPTGPLHVGHGRGAAYGAALANLLRAVGCSVHTEYYVNDAGRQMDILALSVWLRYLEQHAYTVVMPDNAYRGAYIHDIAEAVSQTYGAQFLPTTFTPPQCADTADVETFLDVFIELCRTTLGEANYRTLHRFGCDSILTGIRDDLSRFGVVFDRWYSEQSLVEQGLLASALETLKLTSSVYEQDGALWFRSTGFGDEKDRVVIRDNGAPTYFASDIAYHVDKFSRGFDLALNVWGADHHGYISRVKAALQVMGIDPSRLEILLVQFASLYRSGQKVQMSTRSGEFVTLNELIADVGVDAARFFYISRRSDQHLDFDLDLAKAQSQENPVYYLQYAHARICSVFRALAQTGESFDREGALSHLGRLIESKERNLSTLLSRYTDVIWYAAQNREPHSLANYLRDLATEYHAYYNTHKILVEEFPLRSARLALCAAIKHVLQDGLSLLGVSAPEEM